MREPHAERGLSEVARGTAFVLGTRLLGVAMAIASSVITARVLGPTGRGTLAVVMLVPALLMKIGNGGLQIANVYFLGHKRFGLAKMVSQSLTFALASSVIMITLFWVILPYVQGSLLRNADPLLLALAVSTLPMGLASLYIGAILLGINDLKGYNLLALCGGLFALIAMFLALVVYRGALRGAVWAIWISSLATALLGLGFLSNRAKLRLGLDRDVLVSSLAYGLKGQAGNVVQFLNYRLDIFLVNLWLAPAQLGYYALAVSIAEILRLLPDALQTVLFPKMSSTTSAEANDLAPLTFRVSSVTLILALAVLFALSSPLIRLLYGPAFLPALPALWILLPAVGVLMSSAAFTSYLAGRGYVVYNTWGTLLALVATLSLDILLIPKWGIAGAAFASLVSYAVTFVVAVFFFRRVSGYRLGEIFRFKRADFSMYSDVLVRLRRARANR